MLMCSVPAASLGELIAHRASRVENAERSCQTSPRLLPALTHTIDNRVDQVLEFQPRIPKGNYSQIPNMPSHIEKFRTFKFMSL